MNQIKIFGLIVFAGLAFVFLHPAQAQAATCDTSFPNDQFFVCFFGDTSAPEGSVNALNQYTQANVPSPVSSWSGFDENWGLGDIGGTGQSDTVSAVWRGNINFNSGRADEGEYIFSLGGDDGVELKIDGQVIPLSPGGAWGDHGYNVYTSSPIYLTGYHNVQMRYYDNGWDARASLSWSFTPYLSAAYVSQSVPASMTTGQSYSVSVTFRNTGSVTWTSATSFSLGSQNAPDNTNWGLNRVNLPASVSPGNQVTFNFSVTAPAAGTVNFQWKMVQDSWTWFGELTPNVAVSVTTPANPPPTCSGTITPNNTWTTATSGTMTVSVSGVSSWATQVQFNTWSEVGWTDDWAGYAASNQGGGVWSAALNIGAPHQALGNVYYYAVAYDPANGLGPPCYSGGFNAKYTRLNNGTINVTSNTPTTWTITCPLTNPDCPNIPAGPSSTTGSYPSIPYSTWTITPAAINGYDWQVSGCAINTACSQTFP